MDLVIAGWKKGTKTVSLIGVLHARCGMGLKDAKQAVDDLLSGKEILITGLDGVTAQSLRNEVEPLGVVCR